MRRRVGLGAAWLVASLAGTLLSTWFFSHPLLALLGTSPPGLPARLAAVAVGGLPQAALLAVLARRRDWSVALGIGWIGVLVSGYALVPVLGRLVRPLAPDPFTHPPRSAYLAIWIAYFTSYALIQGALSSQLLRWHVRPALLWIGYVGLAGLVDALALYWQLVIQIPGMTGVSIYIAGPMVMSLGLAMLWRWDAEPPRLAWPRGLPPAPKRDYATSESAYGSWVGDLEDALQKRG